MDLEHARKMRAVEIEQFAAQTSRMKDENQRFIQEARIDADVDYQDKLAEVARQHRIREEEVNKMNKILITISKVVHSLF